MNIKNFKNFFSKKKEEQPKVKNILSDEEKFDVEKFNDWFCNEYTGYSGQRYSGIKGEKGIFLRLDKLGEPMIADWFNYLNVDYNFDDTYKMQELIRKNWRTRIANDDREIKK